MLVKVDLHRHLEGAMRLKTLLEIAPQVGIEVPKSLAAQEDKFLVKKPMQDLSAVLKKFLMSQAVLASEEILARITFEAIEDAVAENIRILELRYAPTYIHQGHDNLDFPASYRAISKGVKLAENLPIAVGLLATIQRILPLETAEKVLDFVIEHREHFIGVDLADDENSRPAKDFAKTFMRAQAAEIPITIHAGEAKSAIAPQNVIDSIQYLGAERIGHGLQIINSPEAIALVVKNRIPLEICPVSNWLTQAIPTLADHPVRKLINAGVLVTINSDDPGIFGTSLTADYQALEKYHNFSEADFANANDIAAQASFIPLVKKQKHWPRPIHKI